MDILQARAITKQFDRLTALDTVDFTLRHGEIHALLGENGAGKTTLMNVLSGSLSPTSGAILLDGKPARWQSTRDAAAQGIGMVHQHFQLVPVFSVAENLILGVQRSGLFLRQAQIEKQAAELSEKLGWRIPLTARTGDLPVGAQQRVEILKTLLLDPRILFFDEPTAVLTPSETGELFGVLRSLRDLGKSIVFVSHKLGEVKALCDRVTILRRGRVVGDLPVADTDEADLARRMVGEEVAEVASTSSVARDGGTAVLQIEKLCVARVGRDDIALRDITFSIAPGEILGIAGVDGNGQTELFEALVGLRPVDRSGPTQARKVLLESARVPWPISVCGKKLDFRHSPAVLQDLDVAWISPDRRREGLALGLSIERNLMLSAARRKEMRIGPFLRRKRMHMRARELMSDFDIRAGSLRQPVGSLSGGNQQKVVIARALADAPKLLIAASPTRGLDVGAAAYVHKKLRECQERGAAVLLISTELDEIRLLANRLAVLYEGRIIGIVAGDAPREQIGLMMGGKDANEAAPSAAS